MANCRIIIKNYQNNINKKTTFFSSLEEWRMSQFILFDKQSVLNPKRIKLEGAGKLLNLICTASILTRSTYFSVYVFILIFVLENLIIDNNIWKNSALHVYSFKKPFFNNQCTCTFIRIFI